MDNTRRINLPSNTKTKEGCSLEFDIADFKTRDRRTGEALSQNKVQEIDRDLCADKGATMEGDHKARETAGNAVIEFLRKVFAL